MNYFFRTDIWLTRTEKSAEKPGGFVVRQEKKIRMEIIGTAKKKEEETCFFKSKIGPKIYLSMCSI